MSYKAGFIGLGNMGLPMSKNILKKDGSLLVSDLSEENKQELCKAGATAARSNSQVAEQCDIIFLSLPGPKQVKEVVAGPEGLIAHGKPGQYIIDFSTIAPDTSVELSKLAQSKEIIYIDVPVSGGKGRAADATLSVIAGATEKELDEMGILPYLMVVGQKHHYAGKRGGGCALKVINNFISRACMFADAEGILMAERFGISFEAFYDVISASSGSNAILDLKMHKIKNRDYDSDSKSFWPVEGVLKDMELARQLSEGLGIANFTCNNLIQWYLIAKQRGYGQKDSSCIVELLREIERVEEM